MRLLLYGGLRYSDRKITGNNTLLAFLEKTETFTKGTGMPVDRSASEMKLRSWRYSLILNRTNSDTASPRET